ncbi:hypothetical protein PF002_g33620 [Phytophthora fragariae]|uniref:Uncharacterized protein n=1 Tax=Phytophthora fragariae TaxID=53985 RepID=A0A6A3V0G6_9STRA|nr:hypothetical protein PF006_g33316 [Phytophthora fragariae]KAE9156434.1 hypothetical protein PF002_g33620 [Phytophthora fragariae]
MLTPPLASVLASPLLPTHALSSTTDFALTPTPTPVSPPLLQSQLLHQLHLRRLRVVRQSRFQVQPWSKLRLRILQQLVR